MKKILITGGAGFIGSNLALRLVANGNIVTIIDSLSPQIHGELPLENSPLYLSIRNKVNFIHSSILDRSALYSAIAENEIIVHYAAETGTGQSMYQIHNYVEVNVTGTALLLDILANSKTNVKKVVVASSRAIYGEGRYKDANGNYVYPQPREQKWMEKGIYDPLDPLSEKAYILCSTDENSKIHPSSVYGLTKQSQEDLVMTVCPTIGITPYALRYQNVYGVGQSLKNPYTGILSIFSNLIKEKKPIHIFEDGLESRDFVYIDDVVDATLLAIFEDSDIGGVYNVGSGVATSVLEVAHQLVANYHSSVPIMITGNYRIGDIRHNYADLTKITNELGFIPKIDFKTGLKKFTDWVNTQEIEPSLYDISIQELKEKGLFK